MNGEKTIRQLKKEAMRLKIKGYYNMRKSELVEAISKRKTEIAKTIRELDKMTLDELRSFAMELGMKLSGRTTKAMLSKKIRSAFPSPETQETVSVRSGATSGRTSIKREDVEETHKISPNLPKTYSKDTMTGLAVNPNWVYFYWDFSPATLAILKDNAPIVMRVHDVTYIQFNGTNSNRTFEMDLDPETKKYYTFVPQPSADYIAEIGYKQGSRFVPLLRSNLVSTPPSSPRIAQMELWMDLKNCRKFSEASTHKPMPKIEKMIGFSSLPSSESNLSGGGSFFHLSGRRSS